MTALMDEVATTMYFGLIADEETTSGFLLAAIGESHPTTGESNYFIVNETLPYKKLRDYFMKLYLRKNIAILLISSDIAQRLDSVLEKANKILPIILQIPKKDSFKPRRESIRESLADVAKKLI